MQTKSVLYAAVGAPVVAARKVGSQVNVLKDKIGEEKAAYGESAEKVIEGWAAEGEKVVTRISEGKVVEEISSKVDFDQAKEQVSKLRDQLEDMLDTWRSSFRPEKAEVKEAHEAEEAEEADAAESTPAKKPAATKAAKTSAAKTTKTSATTKSSTTAKTGSTKSTSASNAEQAS